ncbi:MAG: hypothetical protein KF754_15105 [Planctomycetes bacterium]|nr:hypothetical protein [Planctomycetota bacterium]
MRLTRFAIPGLLVAGVAALVVSFAAAQAREPYDFSVDLEKQDITAAAGELVIEPRFRAVADDRFPYEVYFNAHRRGHSTQDGKAIDAFVRHENFTGLVMLELAEDEQEGRSDLRLAMQYEQWSLLVDNGRARYSGYVGPARDGRTAKFQEIHADGTRTDVANIPGWVGVNAGTMEGKRSNQALPGSGSAFFSVDDQGRLYNTQYFGDYNDADARNHPGNLIDPVHVALGMNAEFAKGARLKIGETTEVTRRFALGVLPGATAEYRFVYKLERLYGTLAEPTAAKFSFTATPLVAQHTQTVNGMQVSFAAPEIKEGMLVYDLAKGVAADVTWKVSVAGTVAQGSSLRTEFHVDSDYRASLRRKPKTAG